MACVHQTLYLGFSDPQEEEVDDFKKVQVIDDSKEAVSIGTRYLSTLRCCAIMHRLCTISNQMGSSIDRSK